MFSFGFDGFTRDLLRRALKGKNLKKHAKSNMKVTLIVNSKVSYEMEGQCCEVHDVLVHSENPIMSSSISIVEEVDLTYPLHNHESPFLELSWHWESYNS